jgi:amino acid adenylation domain-containing protein
LGEIFNNASIREQAALIREAGKERYASIEPMETREYYPLSSAQKRLYFLHKMALESTAYNMPRSIPLAEKPDNKELENAFIKLIKRHESLRTSFLMINEEPVQKVHEFENVEFKIEYKEVEVEIKVKVEEERSSVLEGTRGLSPLPINDFIRPFDLSQAPLLRVGLMELPHNPAAPGVHPSPAAPTTHQGDSPGNRYILMLDMHHIMSDGLSHQVLAKDFMALYQGKWLPRLRLQYKDYVRWQNKEKENLVQQERYWLKEFEQEIPVLNLPTDFPRPALQSFAGDTIDFHIGKEETDRLKTIILAEKVTMFMGLLAIFNVLLAKLSGQEDIVVGTGIEGRRHENLRPIVGMFVNTLALRNFPHHNISFKKFLRQLKKSCLEAFDHQEYQFEDLVDTLEVKRDSSRNPLFDVMFQFNNLQNPGPAPQKPKPQIPGFERKVSKFDLTLWAVEGAGELLFTFEYCTTLFKKDTIEIFIKYFREITTTVLTNPAKKLTEIEAISTQRKKETLFQLNEELSTEVRMIEKKGSILQEKLGKNLEHFKNNTAIEYRNRLLTYSLLQERSSQIANRLIYKGIKKGTFIGVLIENRMDLILMMIGILKAGCVFVPLESAYPRDRLETMINSTGIEFVIGDTDNFNKLSAPGKIANQPPEFILFNHLILDEKPSGYVNKPGMRWGPQDKIYVYFTSGTTGKPRAILGKNKSLLHFINWEIDTFGVNRNFRFSQLTNPGFDAFLRDVWVPLCSGAAICIPGSNETSLDSNELINWLEKSRITLIHCVPGLFRLFNSPGLTRENFKTLKFILLSGERIEPTDLVNWYQVFAHRIQLVNLWGTSETTLAKTCYFIHPEDINRERVPVGKPIAGAKVLILDDHLKLCDPLVTGEIYIQTPFRSYGYHNDVELNKACFIRSPFSNDGSDILHKTGDVGRWLPNGNIDLLGRNDRQVKIRGIRVEPGEIESVLIKHPAVKEAVVIKKEISNKNELLCGYISVRISRGHPGNEQEGKGEESLLIDVKEYLSQRLPGYMVPGKLIQIEAIPRTPNGKIDHNALPDPLPGDKILRPIRSPRDRVEEKLLELWTDLLGINTIGINNNFFELGGNSLNIMILASRIHREFDVRIPLGEIFNNASIREQAALIREAGKERYASIEPVETREYYPLSSAQKRLYIIQLMDLEGTAYNMPQFIPLAEKPDSKELENAFIKLIKRHESLRTSFLMINEEPVQKVHEFENVEFKIEYKEVEVEIKVKVEEERSSVLEGTRGLAPLPEEPAAVLINSFIRPFDLSQAPLLRVGLMELPHTPAALRVHPRRGAYNTQKGREQKYALMVDMHHIISDGVSMDILVKDFSHLYNNAQLPELYLQYRDYSQWQVKSLDSRYMKKQEEYWLSQFEGEIPQLNLPLDYERPVVQSYEGDMVVGEIGPGETTRLKEIASKKGATLNMLILAIFNVLLSKYTDQEDMIVGIVVNGRFHNDLERIIGMFVNMLALRNRPSYKKRFIDFLGEVKESSIKAFDNQAYPFDTLIEKLKLNRYMNRNPLFDAVFHFRAPDNPAKTAEPAGTGVKNLGIKPDNSKFKRSKFDLLLNAIEFKEIIAYQLVYCRKLFKKSTIERMNSAFKSIVNQVIENPSLQLLEIDITDVGRINKVESFPLISDSREINFNF